MYKKNKTALTFFLVLTFLCTHFFCYSQEIKQVIKVGYSETINTIISDADSITSKGYGYDVLKKIEEVSNFTFDFIPIKGDMLEAVQNGIVDIAGLSIKTPERAKKLAFSNIQYSKTFAALATNDANIYYNDSQAIDGKTVATYPDNLAQEYLDRYCSFYGISVNYVYGTLENYMDLETDFYITYSQHEKAVGKNNVLNLGVYNVYLTSKLENQNLLNTLDTIFYDIVATEGNYFLELEEKYLGANIELNHRSLSKNEVAILKQRPLEVGYIADYAPISFMNEQGEPDGAMIDVLNRFANHYDFELHYHPYKLQDPLDSHGYYDILVTIYGDGNLNFQYYTPTEEYYIIPMFAQVHSKIQRDNEISQELIGKSSKIGMLQYLTLDYDLFQKTYPNSEIIFYNDWHSLLNDFADEKIDTIISTESSTTYAELYLSDVERTTVHTDFSVPMQFLISKSIADEYVPVFNVMQDNVTENEYRNIINNNSNLFYPETTFLDFLVEYIYYLAMVVFAVILFFFAYANHQQKKRNRVVTAAYNTDALTGFMALHTFSDYVDKALKHAKPEEYELISLDVDMFKTINTYYSNERGTDVIIAIASGLKTAFEFSSACITRRTADQFLVLRKWGEGGSISKIYDLYIFPSLKGLIGEKYNITMSFGSVVIDNCEEKSSSIIGHADTARTLGKNKHETTFITFDSSMKKLYENKINVTFKMEKSLNDREFVVVYQPKVNFETLKVGGAEALVRWRPNKEPQIFPDAFIPVFEENGFIANLDMYVFEEVCLFIKEHSHLNIPRISVNLSVHTVLDENFLHNITSIVSRHGVNPKLLELEITESLIVNDEIVFLEKLKQLKHLGYLISIDDFGAGVSSLNRLSSISADILKLDKVFFSITNSEGVKSNIIVSDVIGMAKHLNMLVVAEGVETIDQAIWLRGIHCDYAQGYYFERPLEKEVFIELLQADKTYELNY